MEMKSKEFRKLSKAEKKAFKKAGGKVKLTTGEKMFIVIAALTAFAFVANRHPAEKSEAEIKKEATAQIIKTAETNCMLDATHHVKIPDSFKRTSQYLTEAMADKTGYVVTFKFTAKNDFGVDMPKRSICKTDNAGKVIKSSFI